MADETLAPTLWRTCRVLTSARRLALLKAVCGQEPRPVSRTAARCGLTAAKAAGHLRALQARGLVAAQRVGPWVFYVPRPDPLVRGADRLLAALRAAFDRGQTVPRLRHALTAFTHPRRIDLVRALVRAPASLGALRAECRMSKPAVHRHLLKLMRRGLVARGRGGRYRLRVPSSPLLRELVSLATQPAGRGRSHTSGGVRPTPGSGR